MNLRRTLHHASLLASVASFIALGCGGQRSNAKDGASNAAKSGVSRYLPLEDKTVFAYDTISEPGGEKGMLVLEVRRPAPSIVELVVAGRVQHLELDAQGIRHLGGGFLLKEPLSRGARFPGDFGTVEVTNPARALSVPAGNFNDCIETVESAATETSSKKTTTVYCAGVGIASRRTEVESDDGNGSQSLSLRSFGPKFDPFR